MGELLGHVDARAYATVLLLVCHFTAYHIWQTVPPECDSINRTKPFAVASKSRLSLQLGKSLCRDPRGLLTGCVTEYHQATLTRISFDWRCLHALCAD